MKIFIVVFFLVFTFNLKSENYNNQISQKTISNIYNKYKKLKLSKRNELNKSLFINEKDYDKISETVEKQVLDSILIDFSEFAGPESKSKFTAEYDSRGNCIKELNYESYDPEKDSYILTEVNNYKFNSQNQIIEESGSLYDEESETWYINSTYEYSFDFNGNLKEKITYNPVDDSFELSEKSIFEYNSNNLLKKEEIYSYMDEWTLINKVEYTYNTNNQISQSKTYYFENENWLETDKTDYVYLNGNLIEKTSSYFNEGTYSEYYSITQKFNNDNRLEVYTVYNIYENEIEIADKKEYKYDEKGNVIEETQFLLNEDTEEIEESFKMIYSYNYDFDKSELIFPNDDRSELISREYNNMPIDMDIMFWFPGYNMWIDLGLESSFHYTARQIQLGVDIKPISKSLINIYPNPAVDILNINLDKVYNSANIEILDITGKSILNQNLNIKKDVNIVKIIKGTYIYLIELDGQKYSGKFIKN